MILPAAPVRYRSGDSEYVYRPDSELFYLTGWTEPNAVAVLRGFGEDRRYVLFVQPRDEQAELWGGERIGPDQAKERFGADAAYPISQFEERVGALVKGADRVYYRLGSDSRCDHAVREALTVGRKLRPRVGRGPFIVADPGAILDPMRRRKDEAEVQRLRSAAELTVGGFQDGLAQVGPGVGEWAVEAALTSGFRRRGGSGSAFAPIVGSGKNACTLHYVHNDTVIEAGDLVLMDAGGAFEHYAGDITRTVPATGAFSGPQRDLYDVVLAGQKAGLKACRAGTTLQAVHEATETVLRDGLVALGLLDPEGEDPRDAPNPFFPHRTSHWLGLDTHDVGGYVDHDGPVKLEPGMVFTVEPGLYIPPDRCPRAPEFEGLGIRIEDDVLITTEGCEVLTESLPTDADTLAAMVRGRG